MDVRVRRSRQLEDGEIEVLLGLDVPARLATLDRDGHPRVVPIWFVWAGGAFHMTSLRDRVHVSDIRRDPRAAICIDVEDPETRHDRQIRGRGTAELLPKHEEWTRRITLKYVLGPTAAREAERRAAMDRVLIRLRPERLVCIGTPVLWRSRSTPWRGPTRTLVVVNGPIASGKNAVSTALAGLLEGQGRRAAVIDLDELWHMLDHQAPRSHALDHWTEARRAAAALTDEFYRSGRDSVIVNGPFFTQAERTGFLEHLRTPAISLFATLRVSFEEAWGRAQGDPRRVSSKQREWLRERFSESERLMSPLPASDLVIDTDGRTPDEIATDIVAALAARRDTLQISFHPESDEPALVAAAADYQRLWDAEGARIVEWLAALTGLRFAEGPLDALVLEGVSQSHPLRLRASYDEDTKLGTLIHELAHRLIAAHRARATSPQPRRDREEHELIYLFLFDVWADLYGEAFAWRQVEAESRRRPMYREAWEATLAMDRAARAATFAYELTRSKSDAR